MLKDENRNNTIDAFESNNLTFLITNSGPGPAIGLVAEAIITGTKDGITCKKNHLLPEIEPGKKQEVSIPISSSRFTSDGLISIGISLIEPNGFSPDPFSVDIKTQSFNAPRLEVVDFLTSMNTWAPNLPVDFDVLLQNTGQSSAENINVNLTLPNTVTCYSNNVSISIDKLSPSETITISYNIIVPRNFSKNHVDAYLNVTEKFGDYGVSWSHEFPFKSINNNGKTISIESSASNDGTIINRGSLNNKYQTDEISFQSSDSTFYINSIAVIPKEIKACDGSVSSADELASYTETNILSHYNVTDRRHLEAILDEQRLQMSGLTFEETVLESGCIENAQAYLFVREGCLKGDEIIELRLVHCETSTLVWSCVGKNTSIDEILGRIDEELSKD